MTLRTTFFFDKPQTQVFDFGALTAGSNPSPGLSTDKANNFSSLVVLQDQHSNLPCPRVSDEDRRAVQRPELPHLKEYDALAIWTNTVGC